MDIISIDGARAIELLREVVAEHGEDTVYERSDRGMCEYVRDNACSCLVGHALFRAGASIDQLSALDLLDWDEGSSAIADVDPSWLHLTNSARSAFAVAQREQDRGETWGEALSAAEAEVS